MNELYKKAYTELKKHGVYFGAFDLPVQGSVSKRNVKGTAGTYDFPKSEEQLERFFTGVPSVHLGELYKKGVYPQPVFNMEDVLGLPFNIFASLTSPNIVVFDCDNKNGKQGTELFKKLLKQSFADAGKPFPGFNKLLRCAIKTPSGGRHYYFLQKPPKRSLRFGERKHDLTYLGLPGVEIYPGNKDGFGVMFFGTVVEAKKVPFDEKKKTFEYNYVGQYDVERWDGLDPLPAEVYFYLLKREKEKKLSKKNGKIIMNSRTFGKINLGKDYSKFYGKEKIEAGHRHKALVSLAGHLILKMPSLAEAKAEFLRLCKEKTEPDYSEDSPQEFKKLLEWLEKTWTANYGAPEALNPKVKEAKKLSERIREGRELLLEIGWEFRKNILRDAYEVFIPSEKRWFDLKDEYKKVLKLAEFEFSESDMSIGYLAKEMIFNREMDIYFEPYHPHKAFFENIEPVPTQDTIIEVLNMLISEKYLETRRLQIMELMIKWLVKVYLNAMEEEYNPVMLILRSSEQQVGKTSFFKWIFGDLSKPPIEELQQCYALFADAPDKNERDFETLLMERMCIVFDDMGGNEARGGFDAEDWRKMKTLTTKVRHEVRKLHTRKISIIRVPSFAGTTNAAQFLTDYENKRFFVVEVKKYDYFRLIELDLLKFWGEIKSIAETNAEARRWTEADLNFINELAKDYEVEDKVASHLNIHFSFLRTKSKREMEELPLEEPYMIVFLQIGHITTFLKKKWNQYSIDEREVSLYLRREKIPRVSYRLNIGPRNGYFARVISESAREFFLYHFPENIVRNTYYPAAPG